MNAIIEYLKKILKLEENLEILSFSDYSFKLKLLRQRLGKLIGGVALFTIVLGYRTMNDGQGLIFSFVMLALGLACLAYPIMNQAIKQLLSALLIITHIISAIVNGSVRVSFLLVNSIGVILSVALLFSFALLDILPSYQERANEKKAADEEEEARRIEALRALDKQRQIKTYPSDLPDSDGLVSMTARTTTVPAGFEDAEKVDESILSDM